MIQSFIKLQIDLASELWISSNMLYPYSGQTRSRL